MAALLPLFGELVLDGVEAVGAGSIVSGVFNEFKEIPKKLITDEGGKLVGNYAKQHPGSYVDNMVEKAYNHRKKRGRRVG